MKRRTPLYQFIAMAGNAANYCAAQGNKEWQQVWEDLLEQCEELLPSGSGFDAGTSIVEASSKRIVLKTAYHHLDGNGSYDGWTEHTVTVVPDLAFGFRLRISGRDRGGVKDHITYVFEDALLSEVLWDRETVERAQ